MHLARCVFPVSVALLAASTPSAQAAPPVPACGAADPVSQLAETGLQAYRDGLAAREGSARTRALELAVRCYQLAQKKSREGGAKLYHPLGLAYERLGRDAQAADALSAFLREVPESDRLPGVTSQVHARLAGLLRRLGQLDIAAPAGAVVRVDEQPAGTAPLGHLVPVMPGVHVLTSSGPRQVPRSGTITAVAGQVVRVELGEAPPPPPPVVQETPRHVVLQRWALGTLGTGLVLGAAGATLWALANRPTCGDAAAVVTCAQVFPPPGYGIALTALGAVAIGTSITLFVYGHRARVASERPTGTERRLVAQREGASL